MAGPTPATPAATSATGPLTGLRVLAIATIIAQQLGQVRQRSGHASQYAAPAAMYHTGDDRWVSLSGSTNALFAANCRAIGRPDLVDDPRLAHNHLQVQHAAELNTLFGAWCQARPLAEVLSACEAAGGTIAPVHGIDQIQADPQIQARQAICQVPDADFGQVAMATVVPRFAHDACRIQRSGGALGADIDAVFQAELGLSADDIAALRVDGVL